MHGAAKYKTPLFTWLEEQGFGKHIASAAELMVGPRWQPSPSYLSFFRINVIPTPIKRRTAAVMKE